MKTACDLPRDRPEDHKQNRSEPLNLMVERSKGMAKTSIRKTIKKQPSRGVIKKRCSENM